MPAAPPPPAGPADPRATPNAGAPAPLPALRGAGLWRAAAAAMAAMFVLRLAYYGFHDAADGVTGRLAARVFEEATGAATALPLVAALGWLAQRVPVERRGWPRAAAVHAAAFALSTAVHTTAMLAARAALAPLAGLGAYPPQLRPARYAYEAANDVLPWLVLLGLVTLAQHVRAARERERREAALARGLLEAELRALRLQLQPHFLFNALNTVAATMYDDPRAADAQVGALADLLRASLRTTHAQEVPARDELALLDRYLVLMRARFGDRLAVAVEAAPDALDCRVPSMLLQPLVENAVRHGGVETRGRGRVAVTLARAAGAPGAEPVLEVRVRDDGPGLAPGRDPLAGGTGLSATAQRLRLLYGGAYVLTAGDAPGGGFEVVVRIPARPAARPALGGVAGERPAAAPAVA